jgi:oligogalacturonide transport system substrate-binding protein
MKRIILVFLLPALSGALAFSGGSGDKGGGGTGAAKPVTLRFSWWGSDPRHQATLNAIDLYHTLHPNITIEGEYQGNNGYLQKMMTQVAGGTEPDLITVDYIHLPQYTARGNILADLSTQKVIDLSPYPETILKEYCGINGKIVGLPMGTNGFGAVINKAFYAKHNIPLDTVWTWDKMIEEGGRIHRSNPEDYLIAFDSLGTFFFDLYLYSKTGKYWTNDTTYTIDVSRNDIVEAFTVLKQLYDSGTAQPLGETNLFRNLQEQNPRWQNDQLGFMLVWSALDRFKNVVKPGNVAVGKPPFVKGGNQQIQTKPSMLLCISNRSTHIAEAAEFANWLLNDDEATKILGAQRSVPTNQKAFDLLSRLNVIDPEVAAMVTFTLAAPASPPPLALYNSEIGSIFADISEQVVFGRLSPGDAADKFIADMQTRLNALKGQQG